MSCTGRYGERETGSLSPYLPVVKLLIHWIWFCVFVFCLGFISVVAGFTSEYQSTLFKASALKRVTCKNLEITHEHIINLLFFYLRKCFKTHINAYSFICSLSLSLSPSLSLSSLSLSLSLSLSSCLPLLCLCLSRSRANTHEVMVTAALWYKSASGRGDAPESNTVSSTEPLTQRGREGGGEGRRGALWGSRGVV